MINFVGSLFLIIDLHTIRLLIVSDELASSLSKSESAAEKNDDSFSYGSRVSVQVNYAINSIVILNTA